MANRKNARLVVTENDLRDLNLALNALGPLREELVQMAGVAERWKIDPAWVADLAHRAKTALVYLTSVRFDPNAK